MHVPIQVWMAIFGPSVYLRVTQESNVSIKNSIFKIFFPLVYRVSSRIGTKATQRNPVSKSKNKNKNKNTTTKKVFFFP